MLFVKVLPLSGSFLSDFKVSLNFRFFPYFIPCQLFNMFEAHSFIDRFSKTKSILSFPFHFRSFQHLKEVVCLKIFIYLKNQSYQISNNSWLSFKNWHCWLFFFWITFHQLKVGWECSRLLTAALNALYTLIFNSELLADERVKLLEEVKGEEGLIFKIADLYNLLKSKM